jgi:hypothetical protein
MFITGTPEAADGKDYYRANSVHAPFQKNQHAERILMVWGPAAATCKTAIYQEAL